MSFYNHKTHYTDEIIDAVTELYPVRKFRREFLFRLFVIKSEIVFSEYIPPTAVRAFVQEGLTASLPYL